MDSFELNKIAGAILFTLLVYLGVQNLGDVLFSTKPADPNAYIVEGVIEEVLRLLPVLPNRLFPSANCCRRLRSKKASKSQKNACLATASILAAPIKSARHSGGLSTATLQPQPNLIIRLPSPAKTVCGTTKR